MFAIEFQARVKNGTMEIPQEYRNQVQESVRVILLVPEHSSKLGMIGSLLEHLIQDPTFRPLSRNEIYNEQE